MRAHHDGSSRYVPDQAPSLGAPVTVFVETPASVTSVHVRSTPDGEPSFCPAVVDRTAGGVTWWCASVVVRNPVTRYRFLLHGPDGPVWLNALGVFGYDVPDANDFRLVAYGAPPAWARDAVVYQVFPDRFARSPAADGRPVPPWAVSCDWETPVVADGADTPYQIYGGDLDGIAGRLDHVERLGANALYLTPFFPARSNHRYDAASFEAVDPLLGGEAALGRLADAVHGRGMRLLGDLTTNHCGDRHPWFTAAAAGSAEREMFYFDDRGGYESWLGFPTLPKLNWRSALLRSRFFDGPDAVVPRWLSTLDGWRVDVANMTGRLRGDDLAWSVAAGVRRSAVAARPDALLVAEHVHDGTADVDRDGWHGVMNQSGFLRPVWSFLRDDALDLPWFLGVPGGVPRRDAAATAATMRAFASLVSWQALAHSWNLLGSHDTPRVRTVVGSAARQEVAAGLLMTMPGTPMVFAGDEYGLRGRNGEDSRTPMPWGSPTLDFYPALIGLRRREPALRYGGLRWEYASGDVLAYRRSTVDDDLLVLARRAPGPPVTLPVTPRENLYGGAASDPGDGPTLQVWRLEAGTPC